MVCPLFIKKCFFPYRVNLTLYGKKHFFMKSRRTIKKCFFPYSSSTFYKKMLFSKCFAHIVYYMRMSFPYRHLCGYEIVQHSWSIFTPLVRRADMWVIFSSRVASPLVRKIYAHMPALLTCGVKMLHLC